MFKTLLCKLHLGHHWLAHEDPDGAFRRHCTRCGKHARRSTRWSGRLNERDRPTDGGGTAGIFPAMPPSP